MARLKPPLYQVLSDLVLLGLCPCLPQLQMVDVMVGTCCLKPPSAEASFGSGCLYLLLEQVNLGGQHLALLIHGPVLVDLSHKTPIITGELVKCLMDSGEGGATSNQG